MTDAFDAISILGGADVSANPRDPKRMVYAGCVALSAGPCVMLGSSGATQVSTIPYVPGFLGFREVPCLIEAFRALSPIPDLILVDGHGISHPRGLGVASHFGVAIDRPTIGVAKSLLIGALDRPLGPEPGDRVALVWQGRQIGVALRTKRRSNPVYLSIGHRISLDTAVEWVLRSLQGYRLPEPTRQAHLTANAVRLAA